MSRPRLLITWYSVTGASRALALAARNGARECAGTEVRHHSAEATRCDDLLAASAYLFVFPENLAAIAGGMKTFFDRCYYPLLGGIEGRGYALLIAAGSDGSSAVRQAERIATGWQLRPLAPPRIVITDAQTPEAITAPKQVPQAELDAAHDLGRALAEGLAAGIF